MNKRLAVWGWWQGRNLGDNWIKRTVAGLFPEAEFIDTRVQDFSAYDFVICGGGGLFIYDTLRPWTGYDQKTPYGMLGLGAEFPHISKQAYELSRNAAFFYVRDQYSLDCMRINDIERSYDITFASPLSVTDSSLDMRKVFFVWRDGRELLWNEQFKKYICYEDKSDEYKRIIAESFDEVTSDDFQTSANDIESRLGSCGFVISGRYHGIVAAIQKGLPCIAIDICPKIRALMRDCGLEEYCIKIGETGKLKALIPKAKRESDSIRKKQLEYREKAIATLEKQIGHVKATVDKAVNPLRVLHYGSYWMRDNDVVKVMADDLGKICTSRAIDLRVYTKTPDSRIKARITTPNGLICLLDTEKVNNDITDFKPDAVVLNSGGLVFEDSGFNMLSEMGIVSVGIELSDPDVYPYNGAFYAHKFDLFYTNSKYSLANQYDRKKTKIRLLPFAASTDHHFYMPDIEKKYDLVVVGHAREDRCRVIRELSKSFKIGVYGSGWDTGLGEVNGLEHTKAINGGLMYLSFSKTVAGYNNVKVGLFEAMACNQVVITGYMEELNDYFDIGKEIICYKNESELPGIIEYYLEHENEREAIRKNAYARFLKEHTYLSRWKTVKADIGAIKEAKYKKEEDKKTKALLSDIEWSRLYDRTLVDRIYKNIQSGNLSAQSTEMLRLSQENDRILEIGCGSGATTAYLSQNKRICTALDYQDESLILTKALCDKLGCHVHTVKADARTALPFEANEFDIAFQAGLLEHFDREERIEMLSLWRPCCRKMVSLIPNAASLGYRMGKGLMEKSGTWRYGKEMPQYSLIREFEEAGYKVIDEYTVGEKNAVNFLPKTHYLREALEKWFMEMDICGDNCGQGYLLVTIGENPS
jgi:polysaccharide pyruvyl transferase WcaK-like protein/ubiquinone/menaquinone biosynthesis C-methylase UbiE/glycosyltransferase involved in cell wall biosynthesis